MLLCCYYYVTRQTEPEASWSCKLIVSIFYFSKSRSVYAKEQQIDSSPCVRRTLLLGLHLVGMHGRKRVCMRDVCLSFPMSFQCSSLFHPCLFLF